MKKAKGHMYKICKIGEREMADGQGRRKGGERGWERAWRGAN